ncbi:MAG: NADH-quinone oxidoreductase subunit H, partial [Natronomonas sp.]|nr:NADH-quinone oxidoreductase subunit H [Natronomonas sp.]
MQGAPLPDRLVEILPFGSGPLGTAIAAILGAALIGTLMMTMTAVAGPWAKRKVTAAFTDRYAVNRLGPF